MKTRFRFLDFKVYKDAANFYQDILKITTRFPKSQFALGEQLKRASLSVVLNIAEGSTGQTDPEQARFLGLSLRSLMECVACLDLVQRHEYVSAEELSSTRELGHKVFIKLQAMRRTLRPNATRD